VPDLARYQSDAVKSAYAGLFAELGVR